MIYQNCKDEVENVDLWSIKILHSKILLRVDARAIWVDNCLSQKGLFHFQNGLQYTVSDRLKDIILMEDSCEKFGERMD